MTMRRSRVLELNVEYLEGELRILRDAASAIFDTQDQEQLETAKRELKRVLQREHQNE